MAEHIITAKDLEKSCKVLIDNGIKPNEAEDVLRAIGFILLDTDLYPDGQKAVKVLRMDKFRELLESSIEEGKLMAVSPSLMYIKIFGEIERLPLDTFNANLASKLGAKKITAIQVDDANDPTVIRIQYLK